MKLVRQNTSQRGDLRETRTRLDHHQRQRTENGDECRENATHCTETLYELRDVLCEGEDRRLTATDLYGEVRKLHAGLLDDATVVSDTGAHRASVALHRSHLTTNLAERTGDLGVREDAKLCVRVCHLSAASTSRRRSIVLGGTEAFREIPQPVCDNGPPT